MSCPAYAEIRTTLQRYPDSKLGFIVYRCTYESDSDWEKFMTYLTTSVRTQLGEEELGDVAARLDWNVQQDPALLDGASFETVRDRFQAWIASGVEAKHATSRHHACIMVTKESLDDVLKDGPPPEKYDIYGSAWVYLVSAKDGGNDDNCQCYTRIGISYLLPRAYSMLHGPGWASIYNQISP
ncbi:hypothetical protein SVAN01_09397 [Stagonosporopsis vannaccii]|nr:hypothetical protein SVAN01_09397 [Stagonosporopsis vannaccii]